MGTTHSTDHGTSTAAIIKHSLAKTKGCKTCSKTTKTVTIPGETTQLAVLARLPRRELASVGETDGVYACVFEQVVAYINKLRADHGADPLIMTNDMNQGAQRDILFIQCERKHSHDPGLGQNLAWTWGGNQFDGPVSAQAVVNQLKAMVDGWYNEGKNYKYKLEYQQNPGTGHFTQLVWKASKNIGLGFTYTTCEGSPGIAFAANFSPPGNVTNYGEFPKNVGELIS